MRIVSFLYIFRIISIFRADNNSGLLIYFSINDKNCLNRPILLRGFCSMLLYIFGLAIYRIAALSLLNCFESAKIVKKSFEAKKKKLSLPAIAV